MGFTRKTLYGRLMEGVDMKKIRQVVSISFLVLFLLVFSFPSVCFSEQPDPKVWESLGINSFGSIFYYNKTNITKSSNIISVLSYTIESEENKRNMVKRWKNFDLAKSVKYQHYDHTIFLDEFDCQNKLNRRKEYIWYDDKGNVLDQHTNENSNWKSIMPDTIMFKLYKKVCAAPKKTSNKQ
jgi:hypothetical protein